MSHPFPPAARVIRWCLSHDRVVWLFYLFFLIAGGIAYQQLHYEDEPHDLFRTASITTYYPGAKAEEVELLITHPLEKALQGISKIEKVRSVSSDERSILWITVASGSEEGADGVWSSVRTLLENRELDLPEEIGHPHFNVNAKELYGTLIALTGDGYTYRELNDQAEHLKSLLLEIDEVGDVIPYGKADEEITVTYKLSQLVDAGYDPKAMREALHYQNKKGPILSGQFGSERVSIKTSAPFNAVDEIGNVRLPSTQQGKEGLSLSTIAQVKHGYTTPPNQIVHYNGKRAVVLAISAAENTDVLELDETIKRWVAKQNRTLPIGLTAEEIVNTPEMFRKNIESFFYNLLFSFFLVSIVVVAFSGLPMGSIAFLLLASTVCITFVGMWIFGISLNPTSFAAMILSLGLIVDNGVVVSDRIQNLIRRKGKSFQVVEEGLVNLWSILATVSLTTICAFLPIIWVRSSLGEYARPIFEVTTIALVVSWSLSVTVVPMLCYRLLPVHDTIFKNEMIFYGFFKNALKWCLDNRSFFLLSITVFSVIGVLGFRGIDQTFFPVSEKKRLLIDLSTDSNIAINVLEQRVQNVEKWLKDKPEVASVASFIGTNAPRWHVSQQPQSTAASSATMIVNLKREEKRKEVVEELPLFLSENFPDLKGSVHSLPIESFVTKPIQVKLKSTSLDSLEQARNEVFAALQKLDLVSSVKDDWGGWKKSVYITIDEERAALKGLAMRHVTDSLNAQLSGMKATHYQYGAKTLPVVLRAQEGNNLSLEKLEETTVFDFQSGKRAPLGDFAEVELEWHPKHLVHEYGGRTVVIDVEVEEKERKEAFEGIQRAIKVLNLPEDVTIEYEGFLREGALVRERVLAALPFSLGLILLVLTWQFNNFTKVLVAVLALIPMVTGVAAGLFLTGEPFGFIALFGVVGVFGIAINNSVLLVEGIDLKLEKGIEKRKAIIEATVQRVRPILITTVTTVVGLLPLLFSEELIWKPIAVVIASGLTVSALLVLFLCPVLYEAFE